LSDGRIYIVRTPLRQVGGMTYGGPMRIKLGRRRVAYAGFTTLALAEQVCRYWNLPSEHFIEPWEEALLHEAPESRARQVLLFHDEADFRSWLESPATFDVDAHIISLHFAGLTVGQKRSA
jgi:hypothetical protein